MFGYIVADTAALREEEKNRYQAAYCGLCREIGRRSGQSARFSLTYDLTFLILLFGSLYEPEDQAASGRCAVHPGKRAYFANAFTAYAADMNVYLTWCKLRDDERDGEKPLGSLYARLLRRQAGRIEKAWPRQCRAVWERLGELARIEEERLPRPDAAANCFGALMGELFLYDPADHWSGTLQGFGEGLGRFIYLMDAAVDFEKDRKSGSYNPLVLSDRRPEEMRGALMLLMGEAARYFECLPLVRDLSLLRNILYIGVWRKYNGMYPQPKKETGNG